MPCLSMRFYTSSRRGDLRPRTVLLLVLVSLGLGAVRGYAPELPQKQFINQERMRELEALIPTDQPVQFEWGAWLRSSYYWFDDPPVWRGMRAQDFRLWGSFMLTQHHQFYARGRLTYVDWNSGTSYDGDDSYWDGMNLDVGFYKGAISDAINDLFKIELPFRFETRIGRQFMVLGSGLVYSQINDGLEFTLQGEGWKALVFGSKTISSQRNIDDSIPEVFRDRRSYLGWQIDLTGIDKHTPYVFMLFEEDHQDTPIGIENQRFGYDARYVGAGSQGEVLTFGKGHKMRYFCEGVYQYGHSFLAGSAIETRQISAFALDAGVELLFDLRGKPRLNIEWALGSGDDLLSTVEQDRVPRFVDEVVSNLGRPALRGIDCVRRHAVSVPRIPWMRGRTDVRGQLWLGASPLLPLVPHCAMLRRRSCAL